MYAIFMDLERNAATQPISAPAHVEAQAACAQVADFYSLCGIVSTRPEIKLKLNLSFRADDPAQKFVVREHIPAFEFLARDRHKVGKCDLARGANEFRLQDVRIAHVGALKPARSCR